MIIKKMWVEEEENALILTKYWKVLCMNSVKDDTGQTNTEETPQEREREKNRKLKQFIFVSFIRQHWYEYPS